MHCPKITCRLVLALTLTVSSGGCAQLYCLPDDCAAAIYECDLARLAHNLCSDRPLPGCASMVDRDSLDADIAYEACNTEPEAVYESRPLKVCQRRHSRASVETGPPPITARPTMPPKFVPVPTRSVFSRVNMQAEPDRGTIEVGSDSQLSFPGSY